MSDDISVYQSTAGPMALRASKLDGITADENSSMTDLVQKKKDIEENKNILPTETSFEKDNLLTNI